MYRVRQQILCEDYNKTGIAGESITVAVLDTGIMEHPDFDYRLLAFRDFTRNKQEPYDDSSHGTHVCGIIGGSGSVSAGKYCGIAPRCNLVVGKVLDQKGDGNIDDMVAGINWVIAMKEKWKIKILNISIGIGNTLDYEIERKAMNAVERAWKSGLVVVSAAGNGGPKPMSISAIGASDLVITVGCHEGGLFGKSGSPCESYSARGPSRYSLKKPDIVAPGTDIISCNSNIRFVGKGNYRDAYLKKSGTSMSTPIVSGACALLLQKYPYLSNEEVKRRLHYSATDLHENWAKQGWGMVNIKRMLEN